MKYYITFGVSAVIVGIIMFAGTAPSSVEADEGLMANPRGTQQYEIRISGEQNPVKVVEFINKRGKPCTLVYATQRDVAIQLSCNYE